MFVSRIERFSNNRILTFECFKWPILAFALHVLQFSVVLGLYFWFLSSLVNYKGFKGLKSCDEGS